MRGNRMRMERERVRCCLQVIRAASDKTWGEYWEEARQPGEWVDYIFIQVTASYLLRDIVIGNRQNILT